MTSGFTGADIAHVCNEAAIFAARQGAACVQFSHFEEAYERVVAGLQSQNNLLSAQQRRIVATHESGHAAVSWFMKHGSPVLKVSILPRGKGALGYTHFHTSEDSFLLERDEVLQHIAVLLGGRCAEQLFLGKITTGAADDLQKAYHMAELAVTRFGMAAEQ